MRFSIPFISVILLFESCGINHHKPIAINFNYTGFLVDTLTLNVDQNKFSAIIDSLDKPLDFYEELLTTKDFTTVFEHSSFYINNVVTYLADSLNSKHGKIIAVLAMSRKNYFINLNLLYACDYHYRKNLVDEELLLHILYPRLLANREIIKYYKSEQVRSALNDIKNNKKSSSNLKKTIQDILIGKAYRERKKTFAEQQNIDI